MRFHDPLWLLLLPVLAWCWWRRRKRRATVLYSDVSLLTALPRTLAQRAEPLVAWLQPLGLALLVVALARPQEGREEFRVRTEAVAIALCVDKSGSMEAMDFELDGRRVDRMTAVKKVAAEFVTARPNDPIGVVTFGGFAQSVCPLTFDHDAARAILAEIAVPQPVLDGAGRPLDRNWQEERATAVGDAIAVGTARLRRAKAKSKVLVLVTDGESNRGVDPLIAAEAAAQTDIRIYTIGVGSTGTAPIPVRDRAGNVQYRPAHVKLDEITLRKVAALANGKAFLARDTDALRGVYREIDRLEKTEIEGVKFTQYRERFALVLWPGLACVLLCVVLQALWCGGLP